MSADVVHLADRRAKPKPARPEPPTKRRLQGLPVAMQATPGCVRFLVGNEGDGVELWLSPKQASHLGAELTRFARAAEGLSPDAPEEP